MAQECVAGILPLVRHIFFPVGILLVTQVLCSTGQKARYSLRNSCLLPFINFFPLKSDSTYAVLDGFFYSIHFIPLVKAAAFTKHCLSICNLLRYNLKNACLPFTWKGGQSIALDYSSMCMVQEYNTFVTEKQMGFSICIFVNQKGLF